jgi:hypothetical protein
MFSRKLRRRESMGINVGEAPSKKTQIPTPEEVKLKLSRAQEEAANALRARLIYDINNAKSFPKIVPSEKGEYVMGVLAEFTAAKWQFTTTRDDKWVIELPKG